MNSGREPGPEDPRGSRPPPDVPSGEDEETDWPTWRQGAGYSRPTPPDPKRTDNYGAQIVAVAEAAFRFAARRQRFNVTNGASSEAF